MFKNILCMTALAAVVAPLVAATDTVETLQKAADATGDEKAALLIAKFRSQMMTAETVADIEAAKTTAHQILDLLPEEDKPQFARLIKEEFISPTDLLKKLKAQRERTGTREEGSR